MTKKEIHRISLKDRIIAEAKKEANEEISKRYKDEYKSLLKRKADAQKIVDNFNREIEDLELKMSLELSE